MRIEDEGPRDVKEPRTDEVIEVEAWRLEQGPIRVGPWRIVVLFGQRWLYDVNGKWYPIDFP